MRGLRPSFRGDAKHRTRNLEIPRCAIAHLRSGANAPSRNDGASGSRSVLQPLQRFQDLFLARERGLALILFFLDDLVRRVGDEFLVGEFRVDALDIGVGLGDFLVEANLFGGQIDHALEWKGYNSIANHQLRSALRCLFREHGARNPCKPVEGGVPALCPLTSDVRRIHELKLDKRACWHVHLSTDRTNRSNNVNQPTDLFVCVNEIGLLTWPLCEGQNRIPRLWLSNLPQFLSDEWHERMQNFQDFITNIRNGRPCLAYRLLIQPDKDRLCQLYVPIAIRIPDELIDAVGRIVEAIVIQRLFNISKGVCKLRNDPLVHDPLNRTRLKIPYDLDLV